MNISSEAWQAIESEYGHCIPPEVRAEIQEANDALFEQARTGLTLISMKPAISRGARLKKLAGRLYEEWAEAFSFQPGADDLYADQAICFNLYDPDSSDADVRRHYRENLRPENMNMLLAPFFDAFPDFTRACDAAQEELRDHVCFPAAAQRSWTVSPSRNRG